MSKNDFNPSERLAEISWLAGEWSRTGTTKSGQPVTATLLFEFMDSDLVIRGVGEYKKASVVTRSTSLIHWDFSEQKIREHFAASDGSYYSSVATVAPNEIHWSSSGVSRHQLPFSMNVGLTYDGATKMRERWTACVRAGVRDNIEAAMEWQRC